MADPLCRRIADDLRAQIETGQLEPGTQLPPEEKLGELFNASRNTIRDAIKFLSNLGLVETLGRPGHLRRRSAGPAGDHADHQRARSGRRREGCIPVRGHSASDVRTAVP